MIESLVEQIESRFAELSRAMTDPEVIGDRQRYARPGASIAALEPAHELASSGCAPATTPPARRSCWTRTATMPRRASCWPPRASAWPSSRRRSASRWSSAIPTTTRTSSSRSRAARAAKRPGCGPATSSACSPSTPSAAASRSSRWSAGDGKYTFEIKGDGAYSVFKYEGGTHRVQRVPETESQGRIHTSTATVAVLPGGRGRRRPDRSQRPADRRLPLLGAGRPVGQHHRLGGAHHAQAVGHRRLDAGREEPAAEPREGDARAARAPLRAGAGRAAGRAGGRSPRPGRHR